MRVSFGRLPVAHKWLLFALLESQSAAWGAALDGRGGLLERFERLCPNDELRGFWGVVNDLSEGFIKSRLLPFSKDRGIDWIHPSYRDLALEELRGDPRVRQEFLARASAQGLRLATSIGAGPTGDKDLPLLESPKDWERLQDRCVELLRDSDDVLTTLWRNYEAALNEGRDKDRTNRLGGLIIGSLAPQSFRIRETHDSWGIQSLRTYYEIRQRADADMPSPTIVNLVEESSQDAIAELNEDRVYWDLLSGRHELHELVRLILKYDKTQLENDAIRGAIGKATDELRAWGEQDPTDGYSWDEHDESLSDAYEACDNLATMYSTFADLPHLGQPEAESLRTTSNQFKYEASSLVERMPYEEDQDEDYRVGAGGCATSVQAMFVDL